MTYRTLMVADKRSVGSGQIIAKIQIDQKNQILVIGFIFHWSTKSEISIGIKIEKLNLEVLEVFACLNTSLKSK